MVSEVKLKQLRTFAILEGISYLLFAITMPLKYVWEMPQPNYYVGMAHGVLFILYCAFVVVVATDRKWNISKTLICLVASLLPFATFIVDKRILQREGLQ